MGKENHLQTGMHTQVVYLFFCGVKWFQPMPEEIEETYKSVGIIISNIPSGKRLHNYGK